MDSRISGNGTNMAMVKPLVVRSGTNDLEIMNSQSSKTLTVNESKAVELLEKVFKAIQGPDKSFKISIHEETQAIMVKVYDKDTGDLIREIPQEKLLDIAANMMELTGILFDKKA